MVKNRVRWAFRSNQSYKVGDEVSVPVKAKIISVTDGKIVLEFVAKKIQGVGIGGGKVWAGGIKIIMNREELNFECQDKIVVDESNDLATAPKAKAVGVRGIVVDNDKIILGLPIVKLDSAQMELFKKLGSESHKIWLNGTSGKIFIT